MRAVLNASGTMTTLGSSRVPAAIAAEVAAMLGRFVLIDELMAEASAEIAAATGAEAGMVTSSAAAGMALAAAAALAGDDLAAIEDLPDTRGRPARIAVPAGHLVNYGAPVAQALAAAGAKVVPLGTAAQCEAYHLEARLREGLAACAYVVSHHTVREGELPLPLMVELCRAHGCPVIVDMASEYDLTGAVALGADAVVWSAHKFLAGPTAGIVAGRRAFVRAMLLQNRGLGRLMKVGKEGILGTILALRAWGARDHAAERAREEAIVEFWIDRLDGLPGLVARPLPDWTGNPITRVELAINAARAGLHAWEVARRLLARDPAVAVRDDLAEHGVLQLDPCNVTAEEAEAIAAAINEEFAAARARGDGPGPSWIEVKRARARPSVPWLEEGA